MGLGLRTIEDATDQSKLLWRDLFEKATSPLLRAHLGDLLLSSRTDSSPEHANTTIAAYCDVSSVVSVDSLHRTFAIMRANHLARVRNLTETERGIRETVSDMAERSMDDAAPPGIVLRLLDVLSVEPRSGMSEAEREAVLHLLTRAEDAYSEPHSADSIADARRLFGEVRALWR